MTTNNSVAIARAELPSYRATAPPRYRKFEFRPCDVLHRRVAKPAMEGKATRTKRLRRPTDKRHCVLKFPHLFEHLQCSPLVCWIDFTG